MVGGDLKDGDQVGGGGGGGGCSGGGGRGGCGGGGGDNKFHVVRVVIRKGRVRGGT